MAKIKWHRIAEKDLIRKHGADVVKTEYQQKVRFSNSKSSKEINLGTHESHDWQPLKGPFGPHEGKVICNTCGGKWVAWLPKGTL